MVCLVRVQLIAAKTLCMECQLAGRRFRSASAQHGEKVDIRAVLIEEKKLKDVRGEGNDTFNPHGNHHASAEEASILEVRVQQLAQPARSLIVTQPESLWCNKEPAPRLERRV